MKKYIKNFYKKLYIKKKYYDIIKNKINGSPRLEYNYI